MNWLLPLNFACHQQDFPGNTVGYHGVTFRGLWQKQFLRNRDLQSPCLDGVRHMKQCLRVGRHNDRNHLRPGILAGILRSAKHRGEDASGPNFTYQLLSDFAIHRVGNGIQLRKICDCLIAVDGGHLVRVHIPCFVKLVFSNASDDKSRVPWL